MGTTDRPRLDHFWSNVISEVKGPIHTSVNHTIIQGLDIDNPVTCENHIYVKDLPSSTRQDDTCKIYQETADDYAKALSIEDERFLEFSKKALTTAPAETWSFHSPSKERTQEYLITALKHKDA